MLCKERVIAVHTLSRCENEGNAFFRVSYHMEYYATDGHWMVFETENTYITAGADGVRVYAKGEEFWDDGYCLDPEADAPFETFETTVFVGRLVLDAIERVDTDGTPYTEMVWNRFPMRVYGCATEEEIPRSGFGNGYTPVYAPEYLLSTRCTCGGRGRIYLDTASDFLVRCEKCHRSTYADMVLANVIADWNRQKLPCEWDMPEVDFYETLQREGVRKVLLASCTTHRYDEDNLWETDEVILVFETKKFCLSGCGVQGKRATFLVNDLSGYGNMWDLAIRPQKGHIRFLRKECVHGASFLFFRMDDARLCIDVDEDLSLTVSLGCEDDEDIEKIQRRSLLK